MTDFSWNAGANGFLNIGTAKLEYVCHGPTPEQAPTLVLLHEGLGSVSLWKEFPENLAKATGLGVFVYSRAGYGASSPSILPKAMDYMTEEAIDILPKVLNAINAQKIILLGHSDGATISAIYTGSVEDFRVRGLILMAPHFFTEPEGLEAIQNIKQEYETGDLKARLAKYHDNVNCAFWGWCNAWLDPNFVEWNVTEVIDYFRVPILAVQGRDDPYGTLAQINEVEERSYSPVEVSILEDCGHAPHLEQADQTLAAIENFVTRLQQIEAA